MLFLVPRRTILKIHSLIHSLLSFGQTAFATKLSTDREEGTVMLNLTDDCLQYSLSSKMFRTTTTVIIINLTSFTSYTSLFGWLLLITFWHLNAHTHAHAHAHAHAHTHTHTHPFNGPVSRTTRVSRYQKGKTNLDFTEARDNEWQWHQLGQMQVCTLLQTDNHASTPQLSFYRPDALPAAQPTASKHWRNACINNLHRQHSFLKVESRPKLTHKLRLY